MITQDQFFTVLRSFFDDPSRCAIEGNDCCYRAPGEDGVMRKCLIGEFIPDDQYHDRIEGLSGVEAIQELGLDDEFIEIPDNVILMGQECHDLLAKGQRVMSSYGEMMWPKLSEETRQKFITATNGYFTNLE